jgi:hypothetical protein
VNDILIVDLQAHGGFSTQSASRPSIWITFPKNVSTLFLKLGQARYKPYLETDRNAAVASPLVVKKNEVKMTWMVSGVWIAPKLETHRSRDTHVFLK